MPSKIKHIIRRLHPVYITDQLNIFLKDESIGGKLILGAALLSMLVVNTPLQQWFTDFWHTSAAVGVGNWTMSMDLRHWLNEGLMTLFFLVVGLEIKRELVRGELQDRKAALLPVGAALGGMILPAVIYLVCNLGGVAVRGWGIPIATDIAFAVAVLSLLGNRIPSSLKIFLLTLAIADDIGAIIVIAIFYAQTVSVPFLLAAAGLLMVMALFRKQLIDKFWIVVVLGLVLWVLTHHSGIHASIVGAALGLIAPLTTRRGRSVAERAERVFLPVTTFVILPLFAFANAGFVVSQQMFAQSPSVIWGIVAGLVIGKSFGILAACWLLTRTGVATLPEGVRWRQIFGVGLIAGIGFTVSIFMTELAFAGNDQLIAASKLGILVASLLAAVLGYLTLRSIAEQRES